MASGNHKLRCGDHVIHGCDRFSSRILYTFLKNKIEHAVIQPLDCNRFEHLGWVEKVYVHSSACKFINRTDRDNPQSVIFVVSIVFFFLAVVAAGNWPWRLGEIS